MGTMLQFLKDKRYKQTSLSVQKENYAVDMYRKAGFGMVSENDEEYIMVYWLQYDRRKRTIVVNVEEATKIETLKRLLVTITLVQSYSIFY